MIKVERYDDLASFTYYNLSVVLHIIALEWQLDSPISLGWTTLPCGKERHFIDKKYLCTLTLALAYKGFAVKIKRQKNGAIPPVATFEEWDPPNNQEEGMMCGYIPTPEDYEGIKPWFSANPFGAWRSNSPMI